MYANKRTQKTYSKKTTPLGLNYFNTAFAICCSTFTVAVTLDLLVLALKRRFAPNLLIALVG